jgi:hypothetical protein
VIFKDNDIEAGARKLYEVVNQLPKSSIPWDLSVTSFRKSYTEAMISIMKAMDAPINVRKK